MSDPTTTPTPTETRQDVRERHQIVGVGRGDLPGGVYVKCRCDEHVLIPAAAYTDHVLAAVSAAAPDERESLAEDVWRALVREVVDTILAARPAPAVSAAARNVTQAVTATVDAILAARPAPVVSGAMADAAIEALGMNAYMTPERVAAHHAALGVVWTDPRAVAYAPAWLRGEGR